MVQSNTATAEQSAAASQELSGQADRLNALLDKFRLKTEPYKRELESTASFAVKEETTVPAIEEKAPLDVEEKALSAVEVKTHETEKKLVNVEEKTSKQLSKKPFENAGKKLSDKVEKSSIEDKKAESKKEVKKESLSKSENLKKEHLPKSEGLKKESLPKNAENALKTKKESTKKTEAVKKPAPEKSVVPVVEEGQSLVDISGMDGMDLSQIPIPGDAHYVPNEATKPAKTGTINKKEQSSSESKFEREENLAKDLGKIRKTEYKRSILPADDDKY